MNNLTQKVTTPFLKKLLEKNIRFDNRSLLSPLDFTILHHHHTVFVNSTHTKLSISYQITTTKPHPDRPNQGIIRFHCVPFDRLKSEQKIIRILKKAFLKKCIDQEGLCLEYNQKCLLISFQIVVLEAATEITRLCIEGIKYAIGKIDLKEFCPDLEFNNKILLNYSPICLYCVSIDGKLLVDPITKENELKDWYCYVILCKDDVLYFEKNGKECLMEEYKNAINVCKGL